MIECTPIPLCHQTLYTVHEIVCHIAPLLVLLGDIRKSRSGVAMQLPVEFTANCKTHSSSREGVQLSSKVQRRLLFGS